MNDTLRIEQKADCELDGTAKSTIAGRAGGGRNHYGHRVGRQQRRTDDTATGSPQVSGGQGVEQSLLVPGQSSAG